MPNDPHLWGVSHLTASLGRLPQKHSWTQILPLRPPSLQASCKAVHWCGCHFRLLPRLTGVTSTCWSSCATTSWGECVWRAGERGGGRRARNTHSPSYTARIQYQTLPVRPGEKFPPIASPLRCDSAKTAIPSEQPSLCGVTMRPASWHPGLREWGWRVRGELLRCDRTPAVAATPSHRRRSPLICRHPPFTPPRMPAGRAVMTPPSHQRSPLSCRPSLVLLLCAVMTPSSQVASGSGAPAVTGLCSAL